MIQRPNDVETRLEALIRLASIPIIMLAILVPYFGTATRLVKGWFTYEEAHKMILLGISLYLLWMNKERLRESTVRPALKIGSAVTLLGCLVLVGGRLSNTSLIQDISLPITLMGLIMLMGGLEYARFTWLPVAYLLFVFEFFDELLGGIAIYLQYAAAWIAYGVLCLMGMNVVISGERLQLPHIVLDVARGCSGINHVVALVALAIPLAFSHRRSWLARLTLITYAFFIGVLANGLRIAVIGLWSAENPGSVHGPHDIFYVSSTFFFGMVLFFLGYWLMNRFWPFPQDEGSPAPVRVVKPVPSGLPPRAVPLAIGVAVLCGTWLYLSHFEPLSVALKSSLDHFPTRIGDWNGQDLAALDSPLRAVGADSLLHRRYAHPSGDQVTVSIAYFQMQDESKKVVSYKTGWLYDNRMKMLPVATGDGQVHVARTVSRVKGREPEAVYFWFDIDGSVTANRYIAKARTIVNAVTTRRTNGALIRLSSPLSRKGIEEERYILEWVPLIQAFLKQNT